MHYSEKPSTVTRRHFVTGGLAALASLTGCDTKFPRSKFSGPHETLVKLAKSGLQFVDGEGQPVDFKSLDRSLDGEPSTVSFMFAACPVVCPTTAMTLQKFSKKSPQVQHIVIAINPPDDFLPSESAGDKKTKLAARLESFGLKTQGPDKNTTVIYPVGTGSTMEARLDRGLEAGQKASDVLNLIHGDDVQQHSARVILDVPGKPPMTVGPKLFTSPNPRERSDALANELGTALSAFERIVSIPIDNGR